ncbi:hypothetical protein [Streptomyces sp. NPDC057386]|uniref:hypothetical protein n=1 Tax=unclassified Streptomyces TaxID=2593676 RepID=UPI0036348171
MNDNGTVTYNSADGATVGVQASVVRDSNIWVSNYADASPQEKYQVGVRFLEDGVPSRARDLISEAIAGGHDNAEVRFHWVLAMLSGRSFDDLSGEEALRLHRASTTLHSYAEGAWKDSLRVAFELLEMLRTPEAEADRVLARLHALPPNLRDTILHHFDLVLTGGMKDGLWAERCERAHAGRLGRDRAQRVWAYFEPEPIGPRALPPRPSTAANAEAALPMRVGAFVLTTAIVAVLALIADPLAALVELLIALTAGVIAARSGRRWWLQQHRQKTRNRLVQLPPQGAVGAPAGDGFTNQVRHAFDHYFSNRLPYGVTRYDWLAMTTQIRGRLAAEIATLYRESRVGVERVNWLIRHLAEDTRDRYRRGVLFDRPGQDRNEGTARVVSVAALVVLGITALTLLGTVADAGGSTVVIALPALGAAVWSGTAAGSSWLEARGEDDRVAEETREYEEQLASRQVAYHNWRTFLDNARPTEQEMEAWLTCDKTVFVDEALRHYQLTWRDVVAHTILVTPARPYKRARVKGGPWRYSRYGFRLFLVTRDGVRELSTEYDFATAQRGDRQRTNYRFDALSSVQVTERNSVGYDLELYLTNGPARRIRVKDADQEQLGPDENADEITEIDFRAAGFIHTFRLLEGIAADGKGWVERTSRRNMPSFQIVG